jgi:hypothetical protein
MRPPESAGLLIILPSLRIFPLCIQRLGLIGGGGGQGNGSDEQKNRRRAQQDFHR